MLKYALPALFLLAACDTQYVIPETSGNTSIQTSAPTVNRSAKQGVAMFRRVAARVEPVAEATCRAELRGASAKDCNFRLIVDEREGQQPNAYQTIGRDGRPIIAFNLPMLQTAQNDDEVAFIMGHEAGHQIAQHITKSSTTATLGGLLLGAAVAAGGGSSQAVSEATNLGGFVGSRAYSQNFELEADVLGTYIADRAGYDPRRGARSFARFSGGGGLLATHPPSGRRLATVNATADSIDAQKARGETPRLPRR